MFTVCVFLLFIYSVYRVRLNIRLRDHITAGGDTGGMVTMTFDEDLRMTRSHGLPDGMIGLPFQHSAEVRKMRDRAMTGGGFCPFTVRHGDRLVRHTMLCHASPGGVLECRGLPINTKLSR